MCSASQNKPKGKKICRQKRLKGHPCLSLPERREERERPKKEVADLITRAQSREAQKALKASDFFAYLDIAVGNTKDHTGKAGEYITSTDVTVRVPQRAWDNDAMKNWFREKKKRKYEMHPAISHLFFGENGLGLGPSDPLQEEVSGAKDTLTQQEEVSGAKDTLQQLQQIENTMTSSDDAILEGLVADYGEIDAKAQREQRRKAEVNSSPRDGYGEIDMAYEISSPRTDIDGDVSISPFVTDGDIDIDIDTSPFVTDGRRRESQSDFSRDNKAAFSKQVETAATTATVQQSQKFDNDMSGYDHKTTWAPVGIENVPGGMEIQFKHIRQWAKGARPV